jgi:hypothetical protein
MTQPVQKIPFLTNIQVEGGLCSSECPFLYDSTHCTAFPGSDELDTIQTALSVLHNTPTFRLL